MAQKNEAIQVCNDVAKYDIERRIESCKYRKKSTYWDERDAFVCKNPNGCVGAWRVCTTMYCGFEVG